MGNPFITLGDTRFIFRVAQIFNRVGAEYEI